MNNSEESPEHSKADSRIKDRSLSNSNTKVVKARINKRISVENDLKQHDKLQILSAEKISSVIRMKIERMLAKSWMKLILKTNSQHNKKYGFVMLNSLLKSKQRSAKLLTIRVMKQNQKHINRFRKYCATLARIERKFHKRNMGEILIRMQKIVKQGKVQKGLKVGQQQNTSKSAGKRPSFKSKKQEIIPPEILPSQIQQYKRTQFSNEVRQVFMSLQKYDQTVYSSLQKGIKNQIQLQIKRFEKSRNLNKPSNNALSDNQLSVNVINNLLKCVNQIGRQSKDVTALNNQKRLLEKKIIQINSQKAQQIRQLRESYKSKQSEEAQRIKKIDIQIADFHKMSQSLVNLYKQNNTDRMRKNLQVQVKRLSNDHISKQLSSDRKQILNVILELLPRQKTTNDSQNNLRSVIGNLGNQIRGLLIDKKNTSSLDKINTYFLKQKKTFQKKLAEAKPELHQLYQTMVSLSDNLQNLHCQIHQKNLQLTEVNQKLSKVSNTDKNNLDLQLKQSLKIKDKDHLKKNSSIQDWIGEWQDIMQNMIERIRTDDNAWQNDINKKKRWISAHKNNQELVRMVNTDITLMNIIAGKEKQSHSYKSSPQRSSSFRRTTETSNSSEDKLTKDKIKELSRQNILLSEQVENLNGRLRILQSQSITQSQIQDLDDVIYNINQTLFSQDKEEPSYWLKLRSSIGQLQHEKLNNVVNCYKNLMQMIEKQLDTKKLLSQQIKQTNDEVTTLKASTKAFALLAQKELTDESMDKMIRNVNSVIRRLQDSQKLHGQLSSLNNLYLEDTKSKSILLKVIQDLFKATKQFKQQNSLYIIKLKEIQTQKQMNQKLNTNLQPMSLGDSGRKLNQLMRMQSSIEQTIQQNQSSPAYLNQKIKSLETQRTNLNDQVTQYRDILENYSNQEQVMLQKMEEYELTLTQEKQRCRSLEEQNQQIQAQKRELAYKYNLIINEKTVIENMLQKQSLERGQIADEFQTKEKVIRQLSKDITSLEAKIKRLQQQNERLNNQNSNLKDRMMQADANNIDLNERTSQIQQLKQQVTLLIREKSIRSMNEQQSEMRQLQLKNEVQQLKILIDEQTTKIHELQRQRQPQNDQIDNRLKSLQHQNERLLIQLQRTLTEREEVFKSYQETLESTQNQKKILNEKLIQKQKEVLHLTHEMQRNTITVSQYQERQKEIQIKQSRNFESIVERLSSQDQYYKNLLETSNLSYDAIIKNQTNEIQRLNKQVTQGIGNIGTIQELQSEVIKLKLQIQNNIQDFNEKFSKKLQQKQQQYQKILQQKEKGYVIEVQELQKKISSYLDIQLKSKQQLQNQQAYFNQIINGNADCYVNNEKNLMDQISKLRVYVSESQTLLKQRELAINNQNFELQSKIKQIQTLKKQLESQKLKQQVKVKAGNSISQNSEEFAIRTKLAYLLQNQQILRGQIDRLAQENRVLLKQKNKPSKQEDGKMMVQTMRTQLRQLESMLNILRQQKEVAIHNMKKQMEILSMKCKQKEIQLIEQEKYNTSLVSKFEERQQYLIQKINATDIVNRELSNHLENLTHQNNNLKQMLTQGKKLGQPPHLKDQQEIFGNASGEVSLAERLRILSLSQNGHKGKDQKMYNGRVKVKTQQNQGVPPYSLTESNQIMFKEGDYFKGGMGSQAVMRAQNYNNMFQQKFIHMSQQNQSLIHKLESLQDVLHEKQMQIIKNNQNWQIVKEQNIKLDGQLKRLNQKLFTSEVKDVLLIQGNTGNEILIHKSQLEKLRAENSFLRYKNGYLEGQIKSDKNQKINKSENMQGEFIKKGYRKFPHQEEVEKQRFVNIQKSGNDLAHRLNSIISNNHQSEQDLLEITILRKISEEVGQLVESNNKLMDRLRIVQKENEALYEAVNKLSEGGQKQHSGNSKILMSIHKMILVFVDWLQTEDIITQHEIKFSHFEEKLEFQIKKNNINKYIETILQVLKTSVIKIINGREQLLSNQAQQLLQMRQKLTQLVNEQIQQITESEYDEESEVRIDSQQKLDQVAVLLKAYSKTKNPKIMNQVQRLLYKKNKTNYR